jgi:hypothetical protein
MATDSISGLQEELNAALPIVDKEIRGVANVAVGSVSPQLKSDLESGKQSLEHRRSLIQTVLNDIEVLLEDIGHLENDGYPTPQKFQMGQGLLDELKGEISDDQAGASVFVPQQATSATITFGQPVPKSEAATPKTTS